MPRAGNARQARFGRHHLGNPRQARFGRHHLRYFLKKHLFLGARVGIADRGDLLAGIPAPTRLVIRQREPSHILVLQLRARCNPQIRPSRENPRAMPSRAESQKSPKVGRPR
jgi:hypothetical protein